jgi:hypothetical protein
LRLEDLAAPDAPAVISEAIRRETEVHHDAANHPPGTEHPTSGQAPSDPVARRARR